MKGNVINLNTLHLNSVRLNGIGKVQSVSLKGGSTEDPVFPPVEPPIEPEPTPTYTLSASVTNGKVSATRNGSAVNLPYTANEGDVIVLSVTPNDGYAFEGWADGNTDNPRTITMTADVALSAQCVEVVQPPVGNYIQFEDAEVERVLMSKGVSSDGVGITKEDAAAVTSISTWFLNNTTITSFNELKYFTSLTEVSPKNDGGYGASAFRGASSLREVTIPASVTRIGSHCFGKCTSLEKVTFEAIGNIREINANAFSECSALSIEVDFPALQILGANAFGKCAKLTKVKSLGSVAELYGSATTGMTQGEFYGCASASEITLPSSLTLIGINCFRNCYALERIICRATTPPSLANVSAFTNTNNCPIYVPDASVEAYKTATNWSSYASRIKGISEYNG